MSKLIGILTAGGDTPGLNAAIRGTGKAALGEYGFEVIGSKTASAGWSITGSCAWTGTFSPT